MIYNVRVVILMKLIHLYILAIFCIYNKLNYYLLFSLWLAFINYVQFHVGKFRFYSIWLHQLYTSCII